MSKTIRVDNLPPKKKRQVWDRFKAATSEAAAQDLSKFLGKMSRFNPKEVRIGLIKKDSDHD